MLGSTSCWLSYRWTTNQDWSAAIVTVIIVGPGWATIQCPYIHFILYHPWRLHTVYFINVLSNSFIICWLKYKSYPSVCVENNFLQNCAKCQFDLSVADLIIMGLHCIIVNLSNIKFWCICVSLSLCVCVYC